MPESFFAGSQQPMPATYWGTQSQQGADVAYAGFWVRFAGGLIDYGVPAIPWVGAVYATNSSILATFGSFIFFGCILANNIILQGRTGQSIGKRILGLRLCYIVGRSSDPVVYYQECSLARTFVRQICHYLDCIFILGWLLPMWNRNRRTFADMCARTVVVYDTGFQVWTKEQIAIHRGSRR